MSTIKEGKAVEAKDVKKTVYFDAKHMAEHDVWVAKFEAQQQEFSRHSIPSW